MNLKARLLGLIVILVCAYLVYSNWSQLWQAGKYSMKIATFGPVGVVGGLFLIAFPSMVGKPKTTKEKVIVLLVFVIGILAGLVNWYLMDPGFFGR
jgi:hypothetical protein